MFEDQLSKVSFMHQRSEHWNNSYYFKMNRINIICLIISILFCHVLCDMAFQEIKDCQRNTISLFGNYYIVSKVYYGPTIPRNLLFTDNSLKYNDEQERHVTTINFRNTSKIYSQSGKVFMNLEGHYKQPLLIFERKHQRVYTMELDRDEEIIFLLVKDSKKKKALIGVKLDHLTEHKNKCQWKTIFDSRKDYTTLAIDHATGDVFVGYSDNNIGNIILLKHQKNNPCEAYGNLSSTMRNLENVLHELEGQLGKIEKFETYRTKEKRILTTLAAALSEIYSFKYELQAKKNNETAMLKRIEDLEKQVENNMNNRILLGTQMSLIVEEFEKMPVNMSDSFQSKVPYSEVPARQKDIYECALKTDFEENKKQNEFQDFTNEEILENLKAVMNEAVSQEEIESVKITDDQLIEDIFGL